MTTAVLVAACVAVGLMAGVYAAFSARRSISAPCRMTLSAIACGLLAVAPAVRD